MAATILGFTSNEIKPQPAFKAKQNENGGWTAQHEFVVKVVDFAAVQSQFAKGTPLYELDDGLLAFFGFLKISDVQVIRAEGDLITLAVTATGSSSGQFDVGGDEPTLGTGALPTYDLQTNTVPLPFSMHPKWKDISPQDKELLGLLIDGEYVYQFSDDQLYYTLEDGTRYKSEFQLESINSIEFAKRIAQGETTWDSSVITWIESTEGTTPISSAILAQHMKIVSNPRGNPPDAGGGSDWMLTGVSQSQTGELYRTRLEYSMSQRGGHDSFLYDT